MALLKWLLKWNELWLAFGLLALWPMFTNGLMRMDPTSAALDLGVLHITYVAAISYAVLKGVVWVTLRLDFPFLWAYLEEELISDFKLMEPWKRVTISLAAYFALLLFFALVLMATASIAG